MSWIRSLLASRQLGLLFILALIAAGFGWASANFRDPTNLLDRTRYWTETGLVAVPMTFIIAAGAIDLSVGSLLALCAMVAGLCHHQWHWPLAAALGAAVLAGGLGGALNGLGVSLLRVPALVMTLATLAIFRGLAMGLSRGAPIRDWPEALTDWGSQATLGQGAWAPPQQLVLLLVIILLGEFILRKTRAGRWTVQIGENETAARYAAVPVAGVRFALFLASGLVCALAAITNVARFATAHPAAGAGLELEAIACVVIGGTRITGGGGSVLGTLLGLMIMGLLRFGMDMIGVLQQRQIVLVGLLVILTAIFNEWLARRRERRRPAVQQPICTGGVA